MRNTRLLAIILILAFAACGKKKAPQSPTPTEGAPAGEAEDAEKSVNQPDDGDDAQDMKTSDPEEGGE